MKTSPASVYRVWRRDFLQFKKSIWVNLTWIVLEPLFFLVALGYGLGSYVTNIGGVPYSEFYFPALLCNTAMMVSFFESTYGSFSKLTYQRTYLTMILTPIEPTEIVYGEILWGATKGFLSAVGVAIVASLFGHVNSFMIIPGLVIIFILALLFSALGMIFTSIVKNYDGIIYPSSGLIVPMSLFSGTYFPIEQLPHPIKYLSYLLPLTHGVAAVRALLLNLPKDPIFAIHILVLIGLAIWATRVAVRRINKKLIQ